MLTDELRSRFAEVEQIAIRKIDELTLTKVSEILHRVVYPVVIPGIVRLLQASAATGAEKKAAALALLDEFYDRRLATINVPGPFDALVHGGLKRLVRDGASTMIDALVAFLRSPEAAAVLLTFQPDALRPFAPASQATH